MPGIWPKKMDLIPIPDINFCNIARKNLALSQTSILNVWNIAIISWPNSGHH